MIDEIKINVDNFAFIDNAEFIIDDITIVKGIGGKGKSDLNRLIYCLLLSVSNEGINIANTGFKEILFNSLDETDSLMFKMDYNYFIHDWEEYNISYDYLNKKFEEYKELLEKHEMKIDYSEIENALTFNDKHYSYMMPVVNRLLDVEFKNGRHEKFDDYNIDITIDGEYHLINDKKCNMTETKFSYELDTLPGNVIYLSPKPIMDFEFNMNIPYHYEELYYLLTENQIRCKTDTTDIIELIENIIGGKFDLTHYFEFYNSNSKEVPIHHLPRSHKQLGVLQLLLQNNAIPEKSILILDNIDSRMDENLQVKTAEILVELTGRLDLLLFINTKNDNFIKAFNERSQNMKIRNYEAIENSNGKYIFKSI